MLAAAVVGGTVSAGYLVARFVGNGRAAEIARQESPVLERVPVEGLHEGRLFQEGNGLPVRLYERPNATLNAAQDDPDQYGMIVDITDLKELFTTGWEVKIVSTAAWSACTEYGRDCQIMGFIGYYSKGKSFLAERVAKAANEELSRSLQRKGGDFAIRVADSVTTKGLSGFFTQDGGKLYLDSAGRNAPAVRKTEDTTATLKSINALRSKERLLDDILIDLCNVLVYVVDEALNEDQRTVLHIIEQYREAKKKIERKTQVKDQVLYIVHNFKRKRPDDPDSKLHIDQQLLKSFNAEAVTIEPQQKANFGNDLQIWKSEYPDTRTDIGIRIFHFVLYDQNTSTGARYNQCVFKCLAQFRAAPGSFDGRGTPVIEKISAAVSKFASNYIRETTTSPATISTEGETTVNDIRMTPGSGLMVIKAFPREPGSKLEVVDWNLRDTPRSRNDGEYQPNHNHFEDSSLGKYFIRVDLAGFGAEDQIDSSVTPPPNKNYFVFDVRREEYDYDIYEIYGFRLDENKEVSPHDSFGKFRIEVPVRHFYRGGDLKPDFKNSVLTITVSMGKGKAGKAKK
jgi:hypothetical protein